MKEIKQLLEITNSLRNQYKRGFPLDGRLVGDIGEVLVADIYGITLYNENATIHDGEEKSSGRKVQIKASFKNYCYFPFGEHRIPDFFIAVNINEKGELDELYNGTGRFLYDEYIIKRNLKPYNKTEYTLSKGILKTLNSIVPESEKISRLK
jgi:hypothetical protein